MYVLPPTVDSILDSFKTFHIPSKVPKDPFFSNPKDIPKGPQVFAGTEFRFSRNESKEELAYAKDMFETIFKDYTTEKDVHISGLLADLMKQTPVTETDFRMLKGKILLILPDQDFFSGKMQKDLIQLMHDPVIQYVSGGHLSTILKADDYVKVIRDFLGNI